MGNLENNLTESKKKAQDLCDYGFLNKTISGYLIVAMQDAGFCRDDIRKALLELVQTFDEVNAAEAEMAYLNF